MFAIGKSSTTKLFVGLVFIYISLSAFFGVYYKLNNQAIHLGKISFGFLEIIILLLSMAMSTLGTNMFTKAAVGKFETVSKHLSLFICLLMIGVSLLTWFFIVDMFFPLSIGWSLSVITALVLIFIGAIVTVKTLIEWND